MDRRTMAVSEPDAMRREYDELVRSMPAERAIRIVADRHSIGRGVAHLVVATGRPFRAET